MTGKRRTPRAARMPWMLMALLALLPGALRSAEYFVSPSGDDSNPGSHGDREARRGRDRHRGFRMDPRRTRWTGSLR